MGIPLKFDSNIIWPFGSHFTWGSLNTQECRGVAETYSVLYDQLGIRLSHDGILGSHWLFECKKTLHFSAKHVILKHWLQGDQLWGMITYPDGIWSPNHYRHSENYGHTLDIWQMWISQCCHPTIWMVWSVELTNPMVSLFDIDRIWKFMPFNGRFQIFVNSFIFPSSNLYPTASTGAFVELPVGPGGSLLRHYRNAWDGWRWLTYVDFGIWNMKLRVWRILLYKMWWRVNSNWSWWVTIITLRYNESRLEYSECISHRIHYLHGVSPERFLFIGSF